MGLSATQRQPEAVQMIRDGFSISEITAGRRAQYAEDNEMLLIHTGSGNIDIDGVAYHLAPGVLVLIGKGQRWHMRGEVSAIRLVFGDSFWDRTPVSARNCKAMLYGNIQAHQHFVTSTEEGENIYRLLNEMLIEFQRPDYSNKADVLAAYLKILIIKVANINEALLAAANSYQYKIYRQFINLLEEDFGHTHYVNTFARKLNIAPRKLMEICQQYGGKPPKALISEQLVAEARRLLQSSSMSIKEIALRLHFSNPFQFSHFFKKHTTLAPLDYRNRFMQISM